MCRLKGTPSNKKKKWVSTALIPPVFREEDLGVFAVNRDKIALKVVPASTVLPVMETA